MVNSVDNVNSPGLLLRTLRATRACWCSVNSMKATPREWFFATIFPFFTSFKHFICMLNIIYNRKLQFFFFGQNKGKLYKTKIKPPLISNKRNYNLTCRITGFCSLAREVTASIQSFLSCFSVMDFGKLYITNLVFET